MKIELTESEVKRIARSLMARSHRFAEKAHEEGNDLRETDLRLRDEYKALAQKMLSYIAE